MNTRVNASHKEECVPVGSTAEGAENIIVHKIELDLYAMRAFNHLVSVIGATVIVIAMMAGIAYMMVG